MSLRFYLLQGATETEVTPPEGWQDLEITFRRDKDFAGAFSEFSNVDLPLRFSAAESSYGPGGYGLIVAEYEALLELSDMSLVVKADVRAGLQTIYTGRLDFTSIRINRTDAIVEIDVRETGALATIKSRFDTPVDLFSTTGVDGATLDSYAKAPYAVTLHSQVIRKQDRGEAVNGIEDARAVFPSVSSADLAYAVDTGEVKQSELQGIRRVPSPYPAIPLTSRLSPVFFAAEQYDEVRISFTGKFVFEFQLSGGYLTFNPVNFTPGPGTDYAEVWLSVSTSENPLASVGLNNRLFARSSAIGTYTANGITRVEIPVTFNAAFTPNQGEYLFFRFYLDVTYNNLVSLNPHWEDVTTTWTVDTLAPASTARLIPLHEAFARAIDQVTDGEISSGNLLYRSDWYGRTDAEPMPATAYLTNGAGAFRSISNGYGLRGYPDRAFNVSLKQLLTDWRAIDAIGMGVQVDEATGKQVIRIEPRRHFFQAGSPVFTFVPLGEVSESLLEDEVFSEAELGYDEYKTEVEYSNQPEPCGSAVYALPAKSTDNKLEAVSKTIAAGAIIEQTRRDQFVATATKDNKYDEKVFAIAVRRAVADMDEAETDEALASSTGILSPETAYNLDLVPARNAARWLPYLNRDLRPVKVLPNKDYSLTFTAGLEAYSGIVPDDADAVLPASAIDAADLVYVPRSYEFEASMDYEAFRDFQANPYATYAVAMPSGATVRVYVDELSYSIDNRVARVVARHSAQQS